MSEVVGAGSLLCAVFGLVCAAAVLVRTRSVEQALPVLLELLLAAGLLRLSQDVTWQTLATAAVVVVLRRLVAAYGLRPTRRAQA